MFIKNRGFIPELPQLADYEFGGESKLKGEVLVANGQWDNFLPVFELQKNDLFDSWSCVSFAQNNCLETIHKRKYGTEPNYSDRFTSVMSGTVPNKGNSLRGVAESARKAGKVLESDYSSILPQMTETQFFSRIPQEIKNKGLSWIKNHSLGYEWVGKAINKFNAEKAIEALKFSPLQTAIDASTKHTSEFNGWNDSIIIYGYEIGKYWKVFGSYPSTTGNFDWDYPFFIPLRFELTALNYLTPEDMKLSLVRNSQTGAIYLVDSDGKKHHIQEPNAFIEYFGQKAWEMQDWMNVEPTAIDSIQEGEEITLEKTLSESLKELLKRFGAMIGVRK